MPAKLKAALEWQLHAHSPKTLFRSPEQSCKGKNFSITCHDTTSASLRTDCKSFATILLKEKVLLNLDGRNSYRKRVICFNHLFFHPYVESMGTTIHKNQNQYQLLLSQISHCLKGTKLPWANCLCLAPPWATARANQSTHIGIGSYWWMQPDGRRQKAKIIWPEMKHLTFILQVSFSIFCLP